MNDREFWIQFRRGLLTMTSAIEKRWNLPHGSSLTVLGATPSDEAAQQPEPPVIPFAQSTEGIGQDRAVR